MVGVKRKVIDVIAESGPVSSSNSLHSTTIDRRTKAIRSCSNWNSALLHGRRTRGPQWDYATASYHVSKGSAEYYKGVTRIQSDPFKMNATPSHYATPNPSQGLMTHPTMKNHVPGLMNPSLPSSNVYPLGGSSQFPIHTIKNHPSAPMNAAAAAGHYGLAQLPANLQSRANLNVVPMQHGHGFPVVVQDADHQFANRLRPTPSQHSQINPHGMGHPNVVANGYPAHMPLVGNPVGMSSSANAPVDSKSSSGMFSHQLVNPPAVPPVMPSPHFQAAPGGGVGVYAGRPMSATPSPAQYYGSN